MKRRYAKGLNLQNVLIVGAGEMGKAVGQKLVQYKDLGFVVKGFLDDEKKKGEEVDINGGVKILGSVEDLGPILEKDNIIIIETKGNKIEELCERSSLIKSSSEIIEKTPVNLEELSKKFSLLANPNHLKILLNLNKDTTL